jgi:regulator of sigma E protease
MNAVLAVVISTSVYAIYGWPYRAPVVDSVVPNKPAMLAGLQRGDSITAVNGERVREWAQVLERVSRSANVSLQIEFVRGGTTQTLTMVPVDTLVRDPATGEERHVGRIGAAARDSVYRERLTLGQSIGTGWNETWRMAGGIIQIVRGLLTGGVSAKQLGGPIQIARVSVEAARGGLEQLMLLIAFLSINVAVLNLLPVPILDGGQILLNVLEAAKGSAFSARTREYILRAGLVAIALLFALVMFNDLRGMFS